MDYKELLYFDIETVSKYRNINEFKNNDKRGYDLFIRKMNRKSDKFTDWKEDENTVYMNKSTLIPEYGKVVCVTMAYFNKDGLKIKSIYNHDEKILIMEVHKILTYINNKTLFGLCGYYIKGFDIPWLNKKMMKYGLKIPQFLKTFNVKPWDMNVFDLSEIWRSNGTLEHSSFDEMLYMLNLNSPKTIMSGSDTNKVYWEEDNIEQIKDYCEDDVKSCVDAAIKIHNFI